MARSKIGETPSALCGKYCINCSGPSGLFRYSTNYPGAHHWDVSGHAVRYGIAVKTSAHIQIHPPPPCIPKNVVLFLISESAWGEASGILLNHRASCFLSMSLLPRDLLTEAIEKQKAILTTRSMYHVYCRSPGQRPSRAISEYLQALSGRGLRYDKWFYTRHTGPVIIYGRH